MVLIMITSWYPPHKATEVAEKYIEVLQKHPYESFEKMLVDSASRPDKDGIEVISIADVEKGKYEEIFNLIVKRMVMLMSIEGFRYKFDTLYKLEEAYPLVGLAPP